MVSQEELSKNTAKTTNSNELTPGEALVIIPIVLLMFINLIGILVGFVNFTITDKDKLNCYPHARWRYVVISYQLSCSFFDYMWDDTDTKSKPVPTPGPSTK